VKTIGQLWKLTCLSGLILGGCESTSSIGAFDSRTLEPSPHTRIGNIIQFDPSSATVVVRLDQRDTTLSEELFVRNKRLEIVAVVQPTGIRTGNSVGMVVIRGEPAPGQEVVNISGN
jgi:hypothetical protein